jgi:superfamily II DNA/RNA helicase
MGTDVLATMATGRGKTGFYSFLMIEARNWLVCESIGSEILFVD